MARVPDDDTSTPDPAPATPFDPLAVNQAVDFQTELPGATPDNESALRAAAAKLGMNFENASPDELEFFSVFAGGDLDSIVPDADPENPLIPGEGTTTTTPVVPDDSAPTPTDSDAPPPDAGADESGRAGDSTPGDGGQSFSNEGAPTVISPIPAAVTPPPGSPSFDIPSTLPHRAPAPAEPAPALTPPEQMVQLADGSLVTVSTYQMLVAQQQNIAPPVAPVAPAPTAPQGFVPNAWSPTPGEYVDERAAAEITAIQQQIAQQNAQFQQLQQQNQQALEMQRQARMQSIAQAAEETKAGYGAHRGLSVEQADALMDNALELGMIGLYSQMYPEDPRRAVAAALENVYWQTPELREAEVARQVEATRVANADAERKRALAGQTVSSPGSVSRVPAPARNASERDAGMVAMIEADPTFVARQNGAR